ncbi:MAG: FHA domain-containing protein [Gemmataceae bacterium]
MDWMNSVHFHLPARRELFRRARQGLCETAGWITWAARRVRCCGQRFEWTFTQSLGSLTQFLLHDPHSGQARRLRLGLNSIGRHHRSDIVLVHPSISRHHVVMVVHSRGGCDLHDTASHNGTFVNGWRVREPVRLHSGDRIQLGELTFAFVDLDSYRAGCFDDATCKIDLATDEES